MIIINDFVPFITLCVIGLLLLLCSIVWHEMGHLLALKVKGINANVHINKINTLSYSAIINYDETKIDSFYVLASGILVGIIPIFILQLYMTFPIWLMIIPYLYGCKYDLIQIAKENEYI
jgi:fatty acid desaturase